jgi:hypothetical protein
MYMVKAVGVMSAAKIMGLLYGCLGLLALPFFLIAGLVGSAAGQQNFPFAGAVGIVLGILAPLLYGLMGFVMGAIGALLYNVFAKWVGGFEVEVEMPPLALAPYPIVPPANPASSAL